MRPRLLTVLLSLTGLGILSGGLQAQTLLYWDTNDVTAGAGGASPTGTWGVNSYWSTSSTGSATAGAWSNGATAVFAAGADATGTYTVSVSGTQTIAGLTIQEGTPTISGGSLSFTAPTTFNLVADATIASTLVGTGGSLAKTGTGTLTLSGINSYTGGTSVIAGTLQVTGTVSHAANDTVVDDAVAPILDITGGGDLITNKLKIGSIGTHSGYVTVDGVGSTVTNTTYLYVADAGTADLRITNGAAVSGPNTSIGHSAGSSGTVLVDGSGSTLTNTDTLHVGNTGLAYLDILNGGLVTNVTGNIGYLAGGQGSVYIDAAGTWTNSGTLTVGSAGTGSLDIYGGGSVTAANALIATSSGLYSSVYLSGSGSSFTTVTSLIVGGAGDGNLDIYNGADVTTGGQATIGNGSGSISSATLAGTGSTWTITSGLMVGNNGTGDLYLNDNAILSVGAGTGTVTLGASSGTGGFYFGNYNGEGGSAAGILNAAAITTGTGIGKVYFESYTATKTAPFYFTKDGTSAGTPVTITGPTQVQNTFGYTVLSGANAYSGGTLITGGTLELRNNTAAGSGTVTLNGGALKVASGTTLTNTLAFGANGGTLGGSGTFGSAISVGSNVHLAPGNSPGILSFSNGLALASGGTLDFEVQAATGAAGTGYDLLSISGAALNITATSGSPFTLKLISLNISGNAGAVSDFSSSSAYAWTIASSAAGINNFATNKFIIDTSAFTNGLGIGSFFVTQSGNDLILNFTPVPEPSTYALMVAGLALVASTYRRRAILSRRRR